MIEERPSILFDSAFLSKLERLQLIARRIAAGRDRAERRSRRTGSSLEFADHRNYARGDDLRAIDWNIYGRLERLFIKLFEEEEDLPVHILVDGSASMQWQPPRADKTHWKKFDYARRLAAALAYIGLSNLDRLELHFFAGQLEHGMGLARGKKNFQRVLNYLGNPPAQSTMTTDLRVSLQTFQRKARRRGLVCILSDFLDPSGWEEPLARLNAARFDIELIQIVDPAESDPSQLGDLRLTDSESGEEMEVTVDEKVVAAYREAFAAFVARLEGFCRRHGHGWMQANTAEPFEDLILLMLREGGLVR